MSVLASALAACLAGPVPGPASTVPDPAWQLAAVTCFRDGEERSGLYKICYYRCPGGRVATTIRAAELCPQTVAWPTP